MFPDNLIPAITSVPSKHGDSFSTILDDSISSFYGSACDTENLAVENIEGFFRLFGGLKYERDEFFAAFDKAFDKDATALCFPVGAPISDPMLATKQRRVELNVHEIYEALVVPYVMFRTPIKVLSVQSLGNEQIEFVVEQEYLGCRVTTKYVADTNPDGKIVHLESKDKQVIKLEKVRASGTTRAFLDVGCAESIRLSKRVLQPPQQTNGRLLCEGTNLVPCDEEGDVVKIFLERKKGFCSPRKGNIAIMQMDGTPYAGGASIFDFRRPCNKSGGGFVIKSGDGSSLVLCQQSQPNVNTRAYVIHSRQPLLPTGTSTTRGKFQFYPWYRIVSFGMGAFENRAISIWNGTEYEPVLKVKVVSAKVDKIVISSLNDNDCKNGGKGGKRVDYAILQHVRKEKSTRWELTIAPGADPALMLCTTAIMDDFVGSFL